jgi:Fe2+ or Zn2+ uptake regulation protein
MALFKCMECDKTVFIVGEEAGFSEKSVFVICEKCKGTIEGQLKEIQQMLDKILKQQKES